MKTNSKLLVDALSVVNGAINNTATLPILQNVLFQLKGNELTLTGSDLETTLVVSIEVESDEEQEFCTDGKKLVEFLKSVGNEYIELNVGNVLEITTNAGVYELPIEHANDYPNAPTIQGETINISGDVLKEGFAKTSGFTGTDDLRPIMTGVYIHDNVFVSTDAHVLSKFTTSTHINGKFIVPKKAVQIIRSVVQDEVTLIYDHTNLHIKSGSVTLITRLIDGQYPNYEAVIPKDNPNTFTFNRKELLNTLQRLSVFANRTTNQIKFSFGSEVVIEAQDVDFSNKGKEVFKGAYNGNDLVIGFNSKYLQNILKNYTEEELTLQMSTNNRAGIIESNGLLNLVMPVMIS